MNKLPKKYEGIDQVEWEIDYENGRILAKDERKTIIVSNFGGSISNPLVEKDAILMVDAIRLAEAVVMLRDALSWYIQNDDTDEQDEENDYYTNGLNRGRKAILDTEEWK